MSDPESHEFDDPAKSRVFDWDDVLANSMIGKSVIIGFTYRTADGVIRERTQHYGVIESVSQSNGIVVRLDEAEGKTLALPPAPFTIIPAERGTYRLRESGRQIVDPDFVTTWTVYDRSDLAPHTGACDGWRIVPEWSTAVMTRLIGAVVQLEIREIDAAGTVIQHWTLFGRIMRGHERNGIEISLFGPPEGQIYCFPPAPSAFMPANRGTQSLPGPDGTTEPVAYIARMQLRRNDTRMDYSFPDIWD